MDLGGIRGPEVQLERPHVVCFRRLELPETVVGDSEADPGSAPLVTQSAQPLEICDRLPVAAQRKPRVGPRKERPGAVRVELEGGREALDRRLGISGLLEHESEHEHCRNHIRRQCESRLDLGPGSAEITLFETDAGGGEMEAGPRESVARRLFRRRRLLLSLEGQRLDRVADAADRPRQPGEVGTRKDRDVAVVVLRGLRRHFEDRLHHVLLF